MTRFRAEGLLLLTTLIWGGTFVVIKDAVTQISPGAFVLSRFLVAGLIALLLWPRSLRAIDRRILTSGISLGVLFGAGFMLQTIGLTMTTASTSAFITGSMVVFIPFVYWFVERRRIRPLHLASAVTALLGLWLFTRPETAGVNVGDVLTLISAVLWAAYVVCLDVWTTEVADDRHKQHALVIMQFLTTIVIAVLFTLATDSRGLAIEWSPSLVIGVLYCAVLASVVTTWIQTRFQRFTHPVRAGVIFAMEPIFAAVIAWIVLTEEWTMGQFIGAAILLATIIVPDVILARQQRT
jgi:drug/metabolite transporter (DMT)-like permease